MLLRFYWFYREATTHWDINILFFNNCLSWDSKDPETDSLLVPIVATIQMGVTLIGSSENSMGVVPLCCLCCGNLALVLTPCFAF